MKRYEKYKNSGVEWIGEVPSHWGLCRLQHIINLCSGDSLSSENIKGDGNYPVFGGNGIRGFYSQYTNNGDFIIIGRQGALCGNINYAHGKFWATEHAVVCYPKTNMALLWLGELLRIMNLNQYSIASAQPGLAVERIKKLQIPVPPLKEQQAIASYLDSQCSKIDEMIEAKSKQIDDLKGYRKSLISEVVTKGLNPDVEMKESGMEWIGAIPTTWSIKKIKHVSTNFDGTHFSPSTVDNGYPYITAGDVRGRGINYDLTKKVSFDDYKKLVRQNCKIEKNDVLLVKDGATTGRVGLMIDETECVALSSVAMLRAFGFMLPIYLMYLMESALVQNQITNSMAGAAMPRITLSKLNEFTVTVPPFEEQQAIAEYLDDKCFKIADLMKMLGDEIEELKKYKTSIISEAVTGKIKVC